MPRNRTSNASLSACEPLERRQLFHCTIDVSGGTMRIIGDDGVNEVSVEQDGMGNVFAACEDNARAASGIKRIVVDLKGGNDSYFQFVEGDLVKNLDVVVTLGTGHDNAELVFNGKVNSKLSVDIDAGTGKDRMDFVLFPGIGEKGNVELDVDGGDAADRLIVDMGDVASKGKVDIDFDGGADGDRLDVFFDGEIASRASVQVKASGGDGNDSLEFDTDTAIVNAGGALTLLFDGGAGDDFLDVDLSGHVAGIYTLLMSGGDGDDELHSTLEADVNGIYGVAALGGAGNDSIELLAESWVLPGGAMSWYTAGGSGADSIEMRFLGQVDGNLLLVARGDDPSVDMLDDEKDKKPKKKDDDDASSSSTDGNDVIFVSADLLPASTGRTRGLVNGQGGNDDLTLALDAAGDARGHIDGGSGFDVCTHTPNVTDENCEV